MLAITRTTGALLVTLALSACATSADAELEQDDPNIGGKDDSPDSADNPRTPSGAPAEHPIVLVHGFNASPTKNGFGPDVVNAVCADGHAVYVPTLPPFAGVPERARVLAAAIDQILVGDADACGVVPKALPSQVNLIAHSMGGLDARYVVSSLGYGDRVASITTVSTPHRGSAMADMSLGLLGGFDDDALAGIARLIARPLTENPEDLAPDLRAAFTSLAEASADEFNQRNPDDARVQYESWAGLSNVAGILNTKDAPACEHKMSLFASSTSRHVMHVAFKAVAFVVAHRFDLIPNDGVVQVASAKWGTFRGCIPADHADEVGAMPLRRFDHVRFFRNRAFELAANGY